jgi:CubicO group peptidase (beta-lactamase class C family)
VRFVSNTKGARTPLFDIKGAEVATRVCASQEGTKMQSAKKIVVGVFAAVSLMAAGASRAQQSTGPQIDMTPVKPELVGFSSERLERLHSFIQEVVDKKELSGAVTILARHGKIVDYRTYGVRDFTSGAAMTKDTLFRDYSMTKPVTGVAMLILYEQGKWLPSDPISKFIPEFANLKVFAGLDSTGKMILVNPDHAPTMHELMTHTAGFSYGDGDGPVDDLYQKLNIRHAETLKQMIDGLAQVPLNYQPGTKWRYSLSMDIQGYIIEKITGQSLPDFMRDQLFTPLGMRDAGFYVPGDKRDRFATLYENDDHDGLRPDTSNGSGMGDFLSPPTRPSGGGGLVSTAEDYYRFAQMLANSGELGGVRVLAPSSVRLMDTNHLPPSLLTGEFHVGSQTMRTGLGYGYDCAVAYDPQAADLPDGKNTFFWDGAASTWYWVDPTNDIVFVGMIQRLRGGKPNMEFSTRPLVYQALVDPSK